MRCPECNYPINPGYERVCRNCQVTLDQPSTDTAFLLAWAREGIEEKELDFDEQPQCYTDEDRASFEQAQARLETLSEASKIGGNDMYLIAKEDVRHDGKVYAKKGEPVRVLHVLAVLVKVDKPGSAPMFANVDEFEGWPLEIVQEKA